LPLDLRSRVRLKLRFYSKGAQVPVTVLVPHDVADRCYLSEALLWAAFSRLPLKFLNDQPDTREDGSDVGYFAQSPDIGPVTSEECNKVGLSPRPVWRSAYSSSPKYLRGQIAFERSDEKKSELQKAFFEAEEFQYRLTEWEGKFDQFTEQPRFALVQALLEERLGATGKMLPRATIEASFKLMDRETEGWSSARYVDREPIPPDFWSSAKIDWSDSLAEGLTEGREVAYGLILIEVAQLLKEFPLPNGDVYGGVTKAGDYLVLTSDDEIRGGAKQGRPSYNWDDFHVEMAKRVRQGLPPKKDACIWEMEKWCEEKWKHSVGKSTLSQKIKPYYDEFVRKSETQKD
jgi:hypothetical protein